MTGHLAQPLPYRLSEARLAPHAFGAMGKRAAAAAGLPRFRYVFVPSRQGLAATSSRELASSSTGSPVAAAAWTKQIQVSLQWIAAFLRDQRGDMHRHFTLGAFRGRGPVVAMSFDASPWGAGGFLTINGQLRSWFTIARQTSKPSG